MKMGSNNKLGIAIHHCQWQKADRILHSKGGRELAKKKFFYDKSYGIKYPLQYCLTHGVWSSKCSTPAPVSFLANLVNACPDVLAEELSGNGYPISYALMNLKSGFPYQVLIAMINAHPNPGKNAKDELIIRFALDYNVSDDILIHIFHVFTMAVTEDDIDLVFTKKRSKSVVLALFEKLCSYKHNSLKITYMLMCALKLFDVFSIGVNEWLWAQAAVNE